MGEALMPGPSAKVPEVSLTAFELVKKICSSDASTHNKATMVQLYFDAAMNEELELLATHVLGPGLEIDASAPYIQGPVSRGDCRETVKATVSLCRRRFAKILRDHQRDIE